MRAMVTLNFPMSKSRCSQGCHSKSQCLHRSEPRLRSVLISVDFRVVSNRGLSIEARVEPTNPRSVVGPHREQEPPRRRSRRALVDPPAQGCRTGDQDHSSAAEDAKAALLQTARCRESALPSSTKLVQQSKSQLPIPRRLTTSPSSPSRTTSPSQANL